jgi:hypothetical protein
LLADPTSRHQEAVAEAELDVDYRTSPIVMGDINAAVGPGQRLPDMIPVIMAGGRAGLLHELTHRAGHTALLIGGLSARSDDLAQLERSVRAAPAAALAEATIVLAAGPDRPDAWARLDANAADRLGIAGVTLLLVRPDGHVGLRADHDHLEALAAYQALVASYWR